MIFPVRFFMPALWRKVLKTAQRANLRREDVPMLKFFKTQEDKKLERLQAFEEGCWVDLVNPTDDEV